MRGTIGGWMALIMVAAACLAAAGCATTAQDAGLRGVRAVPIDGTVAPQM